MQKKRVDPKVPKDVKEKSMSPCGNFEVESYKDHIYKIRRPDINFWRDINTYNSTNYYIILAHVFYLLTGNFMFGTFIYFT